MNKDLIKYIAIAIAIIAVVSIVKNILPGKKVEMVNIEKVREFNEEDFFISTPEEIEAALSSGKPTILTYGSEACPPCVTLKEMLSQLYMANNDDINIKYIELTKDPHMLEEYDIQMTPSVLIFNNNGEPIRKINGVELYEHKIDGKIEHVAILNIPDANDLKTVFSYMINEN